MSKSDFSGKYSAELIAARTLAVNAFHKTASGLPTIKFHFAYACRGDVGDLADNIKARGNQIVRIVQNNFSAASVAFEYLGASELINMHRQNRNVLVLPFSEELRAIGGAYVLLVDLAVYSNFVTDEQGNLKRYLFDSNVRDFLGTTRVNVDIGESLDNPDGPDFWWLNNGVTILATSSLPLGKTSQGTSIQLHDVQIVNGLQTTQSIYQHFKAGGNALGRKVLVKIVVSDDVAVRDKIIEATNNQNPVEVAALNATDRIQRDIEEILERSSWYYERRKNYYKNIGKPLARFVAPLTLSVAVVSVLKRAPSIAGRMRSKFMRNPVSYSAVFNEKTSIDIWPKLAEFIKWAELGIAHNGVIKRSNRAKALKTWKGAVALCAVASVNRTFIFTDAMLLSTHVSAMPNNLANEILEELVSYTTGDQSARAASTHAMVDWACIKFGEAHGIAGTVAIADWKMPTSNSTKNIVDITEEILAEVEKALPPQPWPPKVRNLVAEKLKMDRGTVFLAMEALQSNGRLQRQRGAVILDGDGVVVAIDPARDDGRFQIGSKYVIGQTH